MITMNTSLKTNTHKNPYLKQKKMGDTKKNPHTFLNK